MSVERFVSISHPFGERTLNFRTAFISTTLIWLIGLALALIPVLYWNQLGTHHGSNGLCFPLHIHEPSALGWQYSAFLYIGINGSWYIFFIYEILIYFFCLYCIFLGYLNIYVHRNIYESALDFQLHHATFYDYDTRQT